MYYNCLSVQIVFYMHNIYILYMHMHIVLYYAYAYKSLTLTYYINA